MAATTTAVSRGLVLALVLSIAVWVAPGEGFAQEPDPQLVSLLTQGTEASNAGDYDRAVKLLEASLTFGEFNLTYLNLGRALQKAGKCEPALEAFSKAANAPVYPDVPRNDVAAAIDKYKDELLKVCRGTIKFQCARADAKVQVAPRANEEKVVTVPCTAEPILLPGEYVVTATFNDQSLFKTARVVAGERTHVRLFVPAPSLPKDKPPVATRPTPPEEPRTKVTKKAEGQPMSSHATWGWTALGVGTALTATGLIVGVAVVGPKFDDLEKAGDAGDSATYNSTKSDIESMQTLGLGMVIGGVALAAVGGFLLLTDTPAATSKTASTTGPTRVKILPWITERGDYGTGIEFTW